MKNLMPLEGGALIDAMAEVPSWHGGAACRIDPGLGVLTVVHQVVAGRIYWHRFVLLMPSDRRCTPPFYFEHENIEFAAGIAVDGADVLVSYGVQDSRAALCRIALTEILGALS